MSDDLDSLPTIEASIDLVNELIDITNGLITDTINAIERIQDIEGTVVSNTIIDYLHKRVHARELFTFSKTQNTTSNGTFAVRIKGVIGKEIHIRINYYTEAKTTFKSYANTTYTSNGTAQTPFNRCTRGGVLFGGLVYTNPIINVLGVQRGDEFVGSVGGNARAGGLGGSDIESIICQDDDLLLIFTNLDTSSRDITCVLNMYVVDEVV